MTEEQKFAALLEASKPKTDYKTLIAAGVAIAGLFAYLTKSETQIVDANNSKQTDQAFQYSGIVTTIENVKLNQQQDRATMQREISELRASFSRELENLEDDTQAQSESLDDDFAARIEGVVRTQDANINRRESELRTEMHRSIDSLRAELAEYRKLLINHINTPTSTHIK